MALPEIKKDALTQVLDAASPVHSLVLADIAEAIPESTVPHISNMLMTMQNTEFMAPFDWQEEFRDNQADLENIDIVNQADLEMLRKIMTAHVRIDRFSDGHLDALIRSGYWAACLARISALSTEM